MPASSLSSASTYKPAVGDWIHFNPHPYLRAPPLEKQAIGQILQVRTASYQIRRYLRAFELPNDACRSALASQEKELVQGLMENISPSQILGRCAVQHQDDYEAGVPAPPYWNAKWPLFFSRTGFNSTQKRVEPRSKGVWIGNVHWETAHYFILQRRSTKRRLDSAMEDETPAPFQKRKDVDPADAEFELLLWFARHYRIRESDHNTLPASDVWGSYVRRSQPRIPSLSFGEFIKTIERRTKARYSGNSIKHVTLRTKRLDSTLSRWAFETYEYKAGSCISLRQLDKDFLADNATPNKLPCDYALEKTVKSVFSIFGRTEILDGPRNLASDSVIQGVRHQVPLGELEDDNTEEDTEDEEGDASSEEDIVVLSPPPKKAYPSTPAVAAHASSSSSAAQPHGTAATSPSAAKRDRNIVKVSLTAFISHMKRIDPHRSAEDWDEVHKILAAERVGPDVLQDLGMAELKALGLKVGLIAKMLQEVA